MNGEWGCDSDDAVADVVLLADAILDGLQDVAAVLVEVLFEDREFIVHPLVDGQLVAGDDGQELIEVVRPYLDQGLGEPVGGRAEILQHLVQAVGVTNHQGVMFQNLFHQVIKSHCFTPLQILHRTPFFSLFNVDGFFQPTTIPQFVQLTKRPPSQPGARKPRNLFLGSDP